MYVSAHHHASHPSIRQSFHHHRKLTDRYHIAGGDPTTPPPPPPLPSACIVQLNDYTYLPEPSSADQKPQLSRKGKFQFKFRFGGSRLTFSVSRSGHGLDLTFLLLLSLHNEGCCVGRLADRPDQPRPDGQTTTTTYNDDEAAY